MNNPPIHVFFDASISEVQYRLIVLKKLNPMFGVEAWAGLRDGQTNHWLIDDVHSYDGVVLTDGIFSAMIGFADPHKMVEFLIDLVWRWND